MLEKTESQPSRFLMAYAHLLLENPLPGPVMDLACGDGRNGLFLAKRGLPVIFCDRSESALGEVKQTASRLGLSVETWQRDLETEMKGLPENRFGAVLVFRYLHRPLIPEIKASLKENGLLIYETYTVNQPRFGHPRNPDYLLRPGELLKWFSSWQLIHYFEGVKQDPDRAVASIVCRKPCEVFGNAS
jgi:tellurite methyltransferase